MKSSGSRFLFPGTSEAVRHALAGVLGGFGAWPLAPEDRAILELVLAEVLNNVVEHAYDADRRGVIEISVARACDAIACEVIDRGRPMPDSALPEGRKPQTGGDTSDLPEGGFGWYLIRQLTRDLHYRRADGCNRLKFTVPLGAKATRRDVRKPVRKTS
jgi:serine/threonine-protein kinase RsbW